MAHHLHAGPYPALRRKFRAEPGQRLDLAGRRRGAGRVWAVFAACWLAAALSGCVDIATDMTPKSEAHLQFARRPDVSLAGASVAFVSLDGPPPAISAKFSQMLTQEAAARDLVIADPKKARYLVRGYLSAYATQDGAALEYVWDVFNKDKQRTQRVSDVLEVKGDGPDPWRIAGDPALASVAAKSADDLAAFLSNTPEAAPLAAPVASLQPPGGAEAKPLSYAPVD